MAFWLCLLVLLVGMARPALAACPAGICLVDADGGTGFVTIQSAITTAVAGDTIKVRERAGGDGFYEERLTFSGKVGTATQPIILEPDAGHFPKLKWCTGTTRTGHIEVENSQYVTVRNFQPPGGLLYTGCNSPQRIWYVEANAASPVTRNNAFLNNYIEDFGLQPPAAHSTTGGYQGMYVAGPETASLPKPQDNVIRGNRVEGYRRNGIRIGPALRTVVEYNVLKGLRCGIREPGKIKNESIKAHGNRQAGIVGVGTEIRGNWVDLTTQTEAECESELGVNDPSGVAHKGLYCDVEHQDVVLERNFVYNATVGPQVEAIKVEAECHNWQVRHNIARIADTGMMISSPSSATFGQVIENNVLDQVTETGLLYQDNNDITSYRYNALRMTTSAGQLVMLKPDEGTFDAPTAGRLDTNYYSTSSSTPFDLPSGNATTAAYRSFCDCDAASVVTNTAPTTLWRDPANNDYMPAVGSPLIGAAGNVPPYTGTGREIGLEQIVFQPASARTTSNPRTVLLTYDSLYGALTACTAGAGGFTVTGSTTGAQTPSAVAVEGTTAILTLPTALLGTETITVAGVYNACRSLFAGNGADVIYARTTAFTAQPVANNIGEGPPTGGCVSGPSAVAPAGTNRLLVLALGWNDTPTTPPLNLSAVQYGGQACTQAGEQYHNSVLTEIWTCKEAQIAAATSPAITWTSSQAELADRKVAVGACFYTNINQTTPVTDTEVALSTSVNTIPTTPLTLTTSNPGVAVLAVTSSNNGAYTPGAGWTEQLDIGEDLTPTLRMQVADQTTTGVAVTPSATHSALPSAMAMVAVTLNGGTGGDPPAGTGLLNQTHYRFRQFGVAGDTFVAGSTLKNGFENTPLYLAPGGKVALRLKVYRSLGVSQPTMLVPHACETACEDDDNWYVIGTEFVGQLVRRVNDPTQTSQDVTQERLSPCPTYKPGQVLDAASPGQLTITLGLNECTEVVLPLELASDAVIGTSQVQVKLKKGDGADLDAVVIAVINAAFARERS